MFFFLFLFFLSVQSKGQEKAFQGAVTYSNKEFDKDGKLVSSLVDIEKYFFSNEKIVVKTVSGPQTLILGNVDVYLDAVNFKRYSINHDRGAINIVPAPTVPEEIIALEEAKLTEDVINGYKCKVHFIKYAHQFTGPYGNQIIDTLSCTYHVSEVMKIPNLKIFAKLQGNKNSLFVDGRFQGLPLKVVLKRNNGSKIVLECIDVKEMNVDLFTKLLDYRIEN